MVFEVRDIGHIIIIKAANLIDFVVFFVSTVFNADPEFVFLVDHDELPLLLILFIVIIIFL